MLFSLHFLLAVAGRMVYLAWTKLARLRMLRRLPSASLAAACLCTHNTSINCDARWRTPPFSKSICRGFEHIRYRCISLA